MGGELIQKLGVISVLLILAISLIPVIHTVQASGEDQAKPVDGGVPPALQNTGTTYIANHSTEKAFRQMIKNNDCMDLDLYNFNPSPCWSYPYNRPSNGQTNYYYNEKQTGYIKDFNAHGDFISFYGKALTENNKIESDWRKQTNEWNQKCDYGVLKTKRCIKEHKNIQKDYLRAKYKLAMEYNVPLFIALHP